MFDKFGLVQPYRPQSQVLWLGDHSLWLGDIKAAMDIVALKVNGVKTVISLVPCIDYKYQDILHKVFSVNDNVDSDIAKYFEQTYELIDQGMKHGSVLVHCTLGISRSPTIVIAFIMKKFGHSFSKAFNQVKKKRPIICPNSGFISQLKEYEKQIFESMYPLKQEVSCKLMLLCPALPQKSQSHNNSKVMQSKQEAKGKPYSLPVTDRESYQSYRKNQLKKQFLPSINFVSYNMLKECDFNIKLN